MSYAAVLPAREDGYERKKWNVTEYYALFDLGLLEPHKYELINGEILCKKHKDVNRFALPPLEDGYARKKWSVEDCQAMTDCGLFDLSRFELLEGEIISTMGQNWPHSNVVVQILFLLAVIFGSESVVTQAPIGIGQMDLNSNPEPDVTVIRGARNDYNERSLPDPRTDILLALEVSHSTLRGDMTTKAQVYARNGLREYWIVAITRRELIVHRNPTAQGYEDVQTYSETDSVSPLAAPHASVRVVDLLPANPA